MQNSSNNKLGFLDESSAGRLTIQYAPRDQQVVIENPPRFSWLPVIEEGAHYCIDISQDASFPADNTVSYDNIPLNFFTPDTSFDLGDYHWRYAVWNTESKAQETEWSSLRRFTLNEDAVETPLPTRAKRYSDCDTSHPRLWLNHAQIAQFKTDLASNPAHCGWNTFFEKSVAPWLECPVMQEPAPYPNNQRTAPIWRQTYIDCQELIYAIRHLSVAGQVLENPEYLALAKQWLLEASSWDPAGTTSRAYTDEWAFRVAVALTWGYDWLYNELTEEERQIVLTALEARTEEVAVHLIDHANIHLFPYDSHAVRAVSAVLIPACIALQGHSEKAQGWLDYSIEFLYTVYTPWGDEQGGWAEGPHYWMTGMAYLLEAANLLKNYTGLDLYKRPFFQKTGDFPLYTKAPDTRRATFGDDSTMGDLPCLKIGYNLRQYAGVTGNPAYQWYYEELKRNDPGTEMAFYNWGWWDFNFDDLMYHHDYPTIEAVAPSDEDSLRWFKGVGWAAIQYRMDKPDEHIHFVMKSSPFGSISHSHGDQNAFCLSAFGEDLAIQSGYYVAFNSNMHREWRRQTRSKNAILLNGKGQYADRDKARTIKSTGNMEIVERRDDHVYMKGDATPAYQTMTPEAKLVTREVYFVQDSYFVIVDSVDADEPVSLQWLLHANAPFQLSNKTFRYTGEQAGFYGQFLWSEAGAPTITQETGFPDIDPAEYEGLPVSTCMTADFPASTRHRIATLVVPYPTADPRRIFSFLDDQGYDCELYFTDSEENNFRLVVQKLAKASGL